MRKVDVQSVTIIGGEKGKLRKESGKQINMNQFLKNLMHQINKTKVFQIVLFR